MEVFYTILHIILVILLLIVMGARPAHTAISRFELTRRSKNGDKEARAILEREDRLGDIYSLQRVVAAILLVALSIVGLVAYHWTVGVIVALLIALEAGVVAHWSVLQRRSQRLYEMIEPALLRFVARFPGIIRLIRVVSPPVEDATLNSREELQHLVEQSGVVLTDEERTTILSSLKFSERLVKDFMTPRSMIEAIQDTEILGPLVLDDLHKKGYSRIPVIKKDLDHIVGILYVQNLLTIDGSSKSTKTTARTAMDSKVYYINENQTLDQALSAFLRTHHHLFVVVNSFRETVGVLTLEDVIEALLGRKINDEFDTDDDLRAVAARNPRRNNTSKYAQDV